MPLRSAGLLSGESRGTRIECSSTGVQTMPGLCTGALRTISVVSGKLPPTPIWILPATIASFSGGPARKDWSWMSRPRFLSSPLSLITIGIVACPSHGA